MLFRSSGKERIERVMVHGDGEMSAEQETLGMCARRLLLAACVGEAGKAGYGDAL